MHLRGKKVLGNVFYVPLLDTFWQPKLNPGR